MGQGYDEIDWSEYGFEEYDGLARRGFEDACRAAIQPAEDPLGPPGRWRTREGDLMRIRRMGDRHLRNTIALLERKGFSDHAKTAELRAERERRKRGPDGHGDVPF